jgi:hypothetical protein
MAAVENVDLRMGGATALKEYQRVETLIRTTASKEVQALLLPELKQKWDARDKPVSAQQDELDKISDMIDQFAKNSILYSEAGVKLPSGMGEEKGEKTQIVDKEAYQASQKRRMDLRWAAREYMRANPDFKQGELREYINGLIEPDAKQQARDAAKGTREEAIPVKRPDFLRWYGLPEFIPGPPEAREPLSEEALIKREQEAAKQRTPAAAKPSAAIPQPGESQIIGGGYVVPKTAPTGAQRQTYPAVDSHVVREVTAYRPGGGASMGLSAKVEGGPDDAHGQRILGRTTMEDYAAGRGDYVTVAMDKNSDWQNQYLVSDQYPGVVFRVRDNGGYGNARTGRNWIDIAYTSAAAAKRNKLRDVEFRVVNAADARKIAESRSNA